MKGRSFSLWVLILNIFHTSQLSNLFFDRDDFPYWFSYSVDVDTQDNLTHPNHVSCSECPFFCKTLAVWNPVFIHCLCDFDSEIFCEYTDVFIVSQHWWKTLENSDELTFCEGLRHTRTWEGFLSFRATLQNSEFSVGNLAGGCKWIPAMRCKKSVKSARVLSPLGAPPSLLLREITM